MARLLSIYQQLTTQPTLNFNLSTNFFSKASLISFLSRSERMDSSVAVKVGAPIVSVPFLNLRGLTLTKNSVGKSTQTLLSAFRKANRTWRATIASGIFERRGRVFIKVPTGINILAL